MGSCSSTLRVADRHVDSLLLDLFGGTPAWDVPSGGRDDRRIRDLHPAEVAEASGGKIAKGVALRAS